MAPALAIAELRARTAQLHEEAHRVHPLLDADVDLPAYLRFLHRMFSYHLVLEIALDGVPGLSRALPDLESRRKSPMLLRDLAAFGARGQAAVESPAPQREPFPNVPSAMGSLYVMEGSTLGAQILYRHVQERLGLEISTGLLYLTGYGAATAQKWTIFREALHLEVQLEEEVRAAVAAAQREFRLLLDWIGP